MGNNKKVIFWDWNGTLLNDIDVCIDAMNIVLKKRGIDLLNIDKYKEVFDFPVKSYYRKIGFDFKEEPFEVPAVEFINEYKKLLPNAKLFSDVSPTLQLYNELGYKQLIVSAMESNSLVKSVKSMGIAGFFEKITGLNDDYAFGKKHLFEQLIKKMDFDLNKTTLIGDTLHDYEIARHFNINIILVARGHQSYKRLKATDAQVVFDFNKLSELLY